MAIETTSSTEPLSLLTAVLESMPHGFSIWDDEHRLVLWNRRYAEIYGMDPASIRKGMTLLDVCALTVATGNHPGRCAEDLHALYRQRLLDCADPARTAAYEKTIGTRTIKSVYRRSPGLGWVITHEDVTDDVTHLKALSERERELALQNMRLDAAVNNMSQGLCMFDSERRLVICNQTYASLYRLPEEMVAPGTSLTDILNHRIMHGIHPVVGKERYVSRRIELVENGMPDVDIVELQDGRTISVIHHPMSDGGWVSTHQDVTAERQTEKRIRHLARQDPLTGLANRLAFREHMDVAEAMIARGERAAILCIDLDNFKFVNDTLGHSVGDAVLAETARRLAECCRDQDMVARLGGDEFAMFCGPIEKPSDAAMMAEWIVQAVAEPVDVAGHRIMIGASVGVALAPEDGEDTDTLMRHADLALYRSKDDGRANYHFFEPGMDAAIQARRQLEHDLRHALPRGEMRLVFQPLVDLDAGRIVGAEALLRWEHPERGAVPPDRFIPVAEEMGLIGPIGEWVLREACRTAAEWPDSVRISVNLAATQLRDGAGLTRRVESALIDSGLDPGRLELEVTEAMVVADSANALKTLKQLQAIGVRISVDDLGRDGSFLSFLKSFAFDRIKIDRSFVQDLTGSGGSDRLIGAVAGLGRSLGLPTTAEGVETETQLAAVRAQGCSEAQGFLFARPLDADSLSELIDAFEGDRRRPRSAALAATP